MDSQQTDLQYLQEIRDKIKAIDFAKYEGIKLAKELLAKAAKCVNSVIAEEGAKVCYQEIIDIATQENLLKVNSKDFVEILRLVNDIMWRRDFNIQSTFIDQALARFLEDNKQDFSTPSELLKLVVPISQMGFSARHFQKSSKAMQDMVCKSIESAILGDKAVEVMASAMLHVKNIGFLDQDNAKAILTKINRYYSKKDAKTNRQTSRSSEKDHQEKASIVAPKLEREAFSNIFEIAAYYEAAFNLDPKDMISAGFKRRFFSTSNDLRLDTSDFQREIFEKIYQNIADGKKVAPEKDAQGRVTKVIIDDLIEIELEGKYCKIGKFFKAGDVVIRNKQTKEIISIIELDGKEHEARIDGVWVDRGKYFSRDKIIEKSCRIPLFIKHKDFADYNKDKDWFIETLLQGAKLETKKDFAKEEARKKEIERQEIARRQAEEEREAARKQEEAKKKAEENQRQKLAIGEQAIDFLARANAEIIAKMQAAIEAAKAPSDPSESLQQYKESLQQQLSQLQAQINQIFANPAIERQEVRAETVSSATASEDFEPPIMYPAAEPAESAGLTMLDELEEGDEQEKPPESSESPESEDGVKKYNETEKEFAKHLLKKNHTQVEWILGTADCDLNSFVFLDGEHQGKTAMQFAIETEDQDLVTILDFYNVKNLPEDYHPQSSHPFFDYLAKVLAIAPKPEPKPATKEPEVPDDIGGETHDPLSPNEVNSESDDDRISKIVATISDSFERGDLELFEATIRNLDDALLKRIADEALFSYRGSDKMSLVSFVIFRAMEENKLPDGFIKALGELGFNFSSAEITAGKSAIKTLQYVANTASFGEVTDVANKIFDELASFGAGKTILALALNQDTKGKFFLNRLQEKLTYQEILQAMTKIGKEAPVIMGSAMNEVGQVLIGKMAIDGDDDLVKFFVQNYDLLVEQSAKDSGVYVKKILERALKEENAKVLELVLKEYSVLNKNSKSGQEFESFFVEINKVLDAESVKRKDLDEIDWSNPPRDRKSLKEILSKAISARQLDVAKKAIGALEFDAQTQAEDDTDIMPKIVASGNLDLVISYVKKIASKEKDEKARREIELETLYKCFDCALKKRSDQLAINILGSDEYSKEFFAYRSKADGRGAAFLAAKVNSFIVFDRFLVGSSEHSKVDQKGYLPLHFAVECGNHMVALLVANAMVRTSKDSRANFDQILQFLQSKTKDGETFEDIAVRVSKASDDQSLKERCAKSAKFIRYAIKKVQAAKDAKTEEIYKYQDLAKKVIEEALKSNPFQAKELGAVIRKGCNSQFAMPALLRHLLPLRKFHPESRLVECIEVMVQNGVKFAFSSHPPGATPLEYAIQANLKEVAKIILKNGEIISAGCVSLIWFAQKNGDQDIANFLFDNYPIQFAKTFEALDFQGKEEAPSQEYRQFLKAATDANMANVVKMMLKNREFFTTETKDDAGDKNRQRCEFLAAIISLPPQDFLSQKARKQLFRMALEEYQKNDAEFAAIKKIFQDNKVLQEFEAACKENMAPSVVQVEPQKLNLDACKDEIEKAMRESGLEVIAILFARIQELEVEKEKYNLAFVKLAVQESRPDAIRFMLETIGEEQAFAVFCQAIKDKSDAAADAIAQQQRQIFAEEKPPKPDRWKNFINQKKDGKTILEIALQEDSQTQLRAMTLGNAKDENATYYQLEWKNSGFLFLLIEDLASLSDSPGFEFYHQLFQDILNHQEGVLEESEYKKFINQTNANGSSLLFWMIKYLPNNSLYSFLIAKGIEKGAIDNKDENKNLCFAACKTTKAGNVAMALDILASIFGLAHESLYVLLNSVVDSKSRKTLLMEAAKCSNEYLLGIMLAQQGHSLRALDAKGNSVWHYLASAPAPAKGDKKALQSLEKCITLIFEATGAAEPSESTSQQKRNAIRAAVGRLNNNGDSPIKIAIISGNVAMAKLLVEKNAIENESFQNASSVEEATKKRAEILHLAASRGGDEDLIVAIIARQEVNCGTKRPEDVRELSRKFVNSANPAGNTALHMAVTFANISAIDGLVKNGAKMGIEVVNDQGRSPFHLAVMKGDIKVVSTLLNHQKKSKLPNKQKGGQGNGDKAPKVTEKLIDQPIAADKPTTVAPTAAADKATAADKAAADNKKKLRPIEIAVERDNFEMAELLLQNDATFNRDIAMAMFARAKPEQKDRVKTFSQKNKIPILVLSDAPPSPQGIVAGSVDAVIGNSPEVGHKAGQP